MKKLITMLFGNPETAREAQNGAPAGLTPELFTDSSDPVPDNVRAAVLNPYEQFFAVDYELLGARDGYHQHSAEYQTTRLRQLRSEFHAVVNRLIDMKEARVVDLKCKALDVHGLAENDPAQLQLEHLYLKLNDEIATLEKEKELSALDEGTFMQVVHAYKLGFRRGLADHMAEYRATVELGIYSYHKNP